MENSVVLTGNEFIEDNNSRRVESTNSAINLRGVYNNFSDLFQELDIVAEDEERYNLKWAFINAQNKLQDSMESIINEYAHRQKKLHYEMELNTGYLELENVSKMAKKKAKWKVRMFKIASTMVTVVDILISLALVMIISNISHTGETHISSETLSFLFVLFFAMLKVTLEKYITAPAIERWGWRLYKKIINNYRENMDHCVACLKNKGTSNTCDIKILGTVHKF